MASPTIPTQDRARSHRPPVMVTPAVSAAFLSELVVQINQQLPSQPNHTSGTCCSFRICTALELLVSNIDLKRLGGAIAVLAPESMKALVYT